jgi:hypothetical protein
MACIKHFFEELFLNFAKMEAMQTGKSSPETPSSKRKEARVSPEAVVAAASAEPASAPRKRSVKTAAGDRAQPASNPRTPRTAKHRSVKPATARPVVLTTAATTAADVGAPAIAAIQVSAPPAHERIAELAYSFWLSRGCQDGNPQDDWFRAEHELRSRLG